MKFDQTDHIIVSLVRKLAPRVGKKGILTIFLAKLLFLVDLEYFKAIGNQATDFRYVWYKHGPYPPVQFEDRLANLENYELVKLPMTRMIDDRPYNLFYIGARPRFVPHLDEPLASTINRITDIFKDATWETLLQYVYSLDIVKGLEFGQPVDFGRVQVRAEDEIFLETIANAFKEELEQPLSVQHFNSIQRALSEPTNENIETARRMLGVQRRASQY